MSPDLQQINQRISDYIDKNEERYMEMENTIEELFYSLAAYKLKRKQIEEIVESAVIEHFEIERSDFVGKKFIKEGKPRRDQESADYKVIEARKWFVSFLRYIWNKHHHSIRSNYPFYHNSIEYRHREVWIAAMSPKTDEQQKYRATMLGISKIIKRLAKPHGLDCSDLEYL